MTAQALDYSTLREALGHHPTGVALITSLDSDGQALGMIVGTFTSVSVDPPLVGFFPMKSSRSFERIRESGFFTVNILAHDQEHVCRALMRRQPDKFEGLSWRPSAHGAPVLDDVVLSIDCDLAAVTEAGDHYLATGLVKDVQIHRPVAPLLQFQGGYGGFVPGSFVAPSDALVAESVSVVQGIRNGMEELANEANAEVTAYTKVGDHAVAVAIVKGQGVSTPTVLGSKLPLAPPFGEVFLSGASQEDVDEWLARASTIGEDMAQVSLQRLDHLRRHGWTGSHSGLFRDNRLFPALEDYGIEGVTPARHREIRKLLTEGVRDLQPPQPADGKAPGASLVAPIHNTAGRCEMMLRISHLPAMSGDEIRIWGQQLKALAGQAGSA
ncbi:flavin reductase family protein [Arthrobacter sulfonylureivorans]|uniref:Flavin reductase family protein n=1 Tax=Arthrobacter sulfonylureivorans TaxID=2486855 RepID=A0ABY3WBI2_9MICC|nr:flavin reductase family protein [Arthrobacter sulfonylureivorans]UNK45676.1 flavin reductase family protein [Arthrobacter sulfonylureivorans]